MYNVVEDFASNIINLKNKIDNNEIKDLKEVSRLLDIILKQVDENVEEAW